MKSILKRFLLAMAIVLVVSLAAPPAHTQQADQDQSSTAPRKSDAAAVPAQHANEPQMPASGGVTTQEVKSFSGIVVKENNAVILQDLVTKVSYRLDDPSKAKSYLGKRVKVTGKLDTNSNTILIADIKLAP
jgi:hypothetical protein